MIRQRIFTASVTVGAVVSLVMGSLVGGSAFAAQTALVGGNALKVSPVRQDLTMNPGTSTTVPVFIQNVTSVPATLHMAINDFIAGDENGTPAVILDEHKYAPTHSFKRFAETVPDFTLGGGQIKEIDVLVTVPKSATGGGYYGAIRFEPATASNDKTLNLSASVGSLVLLKVNGDIKEQMHISSFDVRSKKGADKPNTFFNSGKNLQAVVRFDNTGNIQLQPFGKMVLKRFGKQVATFEVNDEQPRGNSLPGGIRRFNTSLGNLSSFGKYTLQGNFGYGSTGQLLTASATFYVVPVVLIIAGVVLIVAVLLGIFLVPRMMRAYNRRVVKRADRRR
ncbi:MAG TPA: hypothetical protein VLH84_01840 [Patescibacteria group bacterium]|nr:hypothetical protein [Patescibacteria group bacterium]